MEKCNKMHLLISNSSALDHGKLLNFRRVWGVTCRKSFGYFILEPWHCICKKKLHEPHIRPHKINIHPISDDKFDVLSGQCQSYSEIQCHGNPHGSPHGNSSGPPLEALAGTARPPCGRRNKALMKWRMRRRDGKSLSNASENHGAQWLENNVCWLGWLFSWKLKYFHLHGCSTST